MARQNEDCLLTFLQKTKDGEYAEIEESSLDFVRLCGSGEFVESSPEELLYYSVS